MRVNDIYFIATDKGVIKVQVVNEEIKKLDESYLKGVEVNSMIRLNEKNLAIQTEEGVTIVEMTTGVT